ncbi:AAA family ATPase [Ralstonia pseudosolanacearum]|uniref:AAA family ATPase n=1 Tax=Ralstonia pseudosolanacearum TaxID=1310165 RepID=UPI0018674C8A|nr:AAA family ATPase [Ralstonia pseudosolanacearum]QOK90505.1 AAA family ATPase [Ralstonia pseudosolanacearum]
MSTRISSLTVRDFRSIRGNVTVPMDAPIVLIHGKNGAGKTSLLSGMELALTGQLSSLDRMDATLRRHLVHKGAEEAYVSVSACGLNSAASTGEFRINSGGPKGNSVLTPQLARHYSERCYLAQSTLSRLLEIYQPKDVAAGASPLTRFVKELLGLDALDALIDGLHDAGHVRRLRGGANLYWEVRDRLPNVQAELDKLARDIAATEQQATGLLSTAQELFKLHWPAEAALPVDDLPKFLAQLSYDDGLQRAAQFRHEITALLAQWRNSASAPTANELMETAESAATGADKALQAWLQTTGKQLSDVFEQLALYFPDLPSPLANRPEYACVTARSAVDAEVRRCEQALAQDAAVRKGATDAEADSKGLQERLTLLDEQIAQYSQQAGQLAQALSALLPHVHSNDCPVCNRNFAEVSSTPLVGHLAANVSSLTEAAGRLAALSKERSNTVVAIAARERELASALARVLAAEPRQELASRLAKLRDQLNVLDKLAAEAARGEILFEEATNTAQGLASLRASNQRAVSLRGIADRVAMQLGVEPIGVNESLNGALERFHAHVLKTESELGAKEAARQRAEAAMREYQLKLRAIEDIAGRRTELRIEMTGLTQRKAAGDHAIEQAKELMRIAQVERTDIVRRVFNDSLNAAWKDLFVRLAPDEPFVPAFALPESTKGAVEATLETIHRDGGKGGNPRAMLSAGNLNTAALTLFLALHLSAKPQLPWLIIDDPVQSMDEVHISQFAALLRTVAKQHGRQIILAVHEKPLFDYLNLELSPAFEGDSLVTIELGRAANGDSLAIPKVIPWVPDKALTA